LIGATVSLFISASIYLAILWCAGLIVVAMWIIYVWILVLNSTSLFVLGSLTGLFMGPLCALSFAWINQKLDVVPILLAAILCGSALGASILQKLAGR
jgi:hypothetical protein